MTDAELIETLERENARRPSYDDLFEIAPDQLSRLLALARAGLKAEEMREALEKIAAAGAPFDAKGTHAKRIADLARRALEPSHD